MAAIDQLKCGGKVKSRKKDGGPVKKTNYEKGGKVKSSDNWLTVNAFRPITRKTAELELKKHGISFDDENFDEQLKAIYSDQNFLPYKAENGKYYKNFPKSFQIGEEGEKTGKWRPFLNTQTGYPIDYSKKQKDKSVKINSALETPILSNLKIPKLQDGGVPSVGELTDTSGNPNSRFDFSKLDPTAVSDFLNSIIGTTFDEQKGKLQLGYDPREDPASMMKKSADLDTGKSLATGATAGAALGTAILPGIGTIIGAGAGTLISGIGRLFGKKGREEAREKASDEWSAGWTDKAASYANRAGYKEGGKIKGKGGPRSDSIKMTAEDGSFIVPVENASTGMDIGKEYLGWNDKTLADRKNRGKELKVSDGEVFYTPEEVGILKYYGVDLDGLAPNAEPEHKMKDGGLSRRKDYGSKSGDVNNFKKGGWKFDKETGRVISDSNKIQYDQEGNEYKIGTSGEFELFNKNTIYGRSIFSEHSGMKPEKEEKEEEKRSIFDYIPELAGTLQTLGGAYGLIEAGKKPDLNVSHTLKKLSAETRRLANFGYEPAVLNALNTQIERTRRDMTKAVTTKGGSPMENMEKMKMILSTTLDKKAGVVFQNAQEKARKWADVLRIDTLKAGQEFDIDKINIADWYKGQEVYGDLFSAGIGNIVGARQLKATQDVIREVGPASPTFTLKT